MIIFMRTIIGLGLILGTFWISWGLGTLLRRLYAITGKPWEEKYMGKIGRQAFRVGMGALVLGALIALGFAAYALGTLFVTEPPG